MKLNCFSAERLYELLKDASIKESIYWVERKRYPDTDDLVKSNERDEIVSYLLEVCCREDMDFDTDTFALFATLLDRFLASFKVKSKYLECLAIACLYIACKVKEEDDKISITSDFLVDCEAKCSVSELLRMETMVLTKFEWSINDITAADFLYLYHAILVNKYRQIESSSSLFANGNCNATNKWKKLCIQKPAKVDEKTAYPPEDLDFLNVLETKLKQCLCINELTSVYKPHVIAFSLISLKLDKTFSRHAELHENKIKNAMLETMDSLKQFSKLSDELLDKCKEQIKCHLSSIESTKLLFDSYIDHYYFNMVKSYRPPSIFTSPLSAINTQLSVIKEEEEVNDEKEELVESDEESADEKINYDDVVVPKDSYASKKNSESSDNQLHELDNLKASKQNILNFWSNSISYADILLGRYDQKRKLSENSISDGDSDIDCETRLN